MSQPNSVQEVIREAKRLEEIERAISRRRRSESPEIWLYFKRVEDTSDPGEQLRRVLAFRKKVEQQHELLFAQFGDIRTGIRRLAIPSDAK